MYIVECYSAIRKDKILSFAAEWMNWTSMLSEISQIQEDKYMFSYVEEKNKIRSEHKIVITRGWERKRGDRRSLNIGYQIRVRLKE